MLRPRNEFHLPNNFEDFGQADDWLRIGPLMLSILLLGICWILILAYLISRMPAK